MTTHFYGFDSFAGLPELTGEDRAAVNLTPIFSQGNYASMRQEYVKEAILSSCRMLDSELTLIKGFFDESLPKFSLEMQQKKSEPLNIAYIDCDLYSSTVDVLKFIQDKVVSGTWLLFDDYWCYRGSPNHGQQKAIKEWLTSYGRVGLQEYCNFDGWGKAFIAYEK